MIDEVIFDGNATFFKQINYSVLQNPKIMP
jgi:hypothetical protein